MQIHSLGIDHSYDEDDSLIGVHTALEDFKLAYLLNKNLSTHFHKIKKGLIIEKQKVTLSFPFFSDENSQNDYDWYLIGNCSKNENTSRNHQLLLFTESVSYLIPEKRKVDFFIKIRGISEPHSISRIVKKINLIHQVTTSYSINKNTLKSKHFLIF